jgi:hypothetical protein
MYHLVNNFQNGTGDALANYRVRLKDADGNYATLYSDSSGTPIVAVSGVANAMVTDSAGQFECYVASGSYDVEFYDSNEGFRKRVRDVPCLELATLGDNAGNIETTVGSTAYGYRITTPSNARPFQIFGSDENHFELMYFGGGGERRTRKYDIISGVTSDNDTSPAGIAARQLTSYRSTIYGSSKQSSMLQVWADVDGPAVQVRLSYSPSVAMSFASRLGKENFVIAGDLGGELRWHIPGSEPTLDDHITASGTVDGAGTLTAALAALRVRSFYSINTTGLLFYHKDGGTSGGGGTNNIILGPNVSIAGNAPGVDANGVPNGTPFNLIQNEVGTTCRIGSSGIGTVLNGLVITAEKPIKMAAYTVATLPSAATHLYGRALVTDANATTFNSVVAGGGSNKVPAFSDGTNWRIG